MNDPEHNTRSELDDNTRYDSSTSTALQSTTDDEKTIGAHRFHTARIHSHKHFKQFTWSWFISPLAALGLSLLLANMPLRFSGLNTIGKIIYLIGVTQFFVILLFVVLRLGTAAEPFALLRRSVTRDSEAYFTSTALMSFSAIIQGAHAYAKPSEGSTLSDCLRVFFWMYASWAFVFCVCMYSLLFTKAHHLKARNMVPAWMLPIFTIILTGPTAGIVASSLKPSAAFPVLICGTLYCGLGILLSLLVLAIYIYRLFESHFPPPDARPGMFLAVGPPSYTGVALLKMSAVIPHYSFFARYPTMILPVQTLAFLAAAFFWMFAAFFFALALGATLAGARKMSFHLTWYSVVFPNCGFGIALFGIAKILECRPIEWVGNGLTVVVFVVWLVVNGFHAEALWRGKDLVVFD